MGCPNSKEEEPIPEPKQAPPKKVDPRLPFETYRQFFNFRNSWKTIQRNMTNLSKEVLLKFFKQYPDYQKMHKNLAKYTLPDDEEKMLETTAFENAALDLFNTLDEVVECAEDKVDFALATLARVGGDYAKMPGFKRSYFTDLEVIFMASVKELFGDRFNDATEDNFKLFYKFVTNTMMKDVPEDNRI